MIEILIDVGIGLGVIAATYLFLCIVFYIRKRRVTREAMKMISKMQKLEKGMLDRAFPEPPPTPKVKEVKKNGD